MARKRGELSISYGDRLVDPAGTTARLKGSEPMMTLSSGCSDANTSARPCDCDEPMRLATHEAPKSASSNNTLRFSDWANAPARLIAVIVLPSPAPGLDTAIT